MEIFSRKNSEKMSLAPLGAQKYVDRAELGPASAHTHTQANWHIFHSNRSSTRKSSPKERTVLLEDYHRYVENHSRYVEAIIPYNPRKPVH